MVSVHNAYVTNQFQTSYAGEGGTVSKVDCE